MKQHDPANYRAMCEPHANREDSQAAATAFFDAVEAARKKFRIKDVVVIIESNVLLTEGDEGVVTASANFGDYNNKLPMLARAYGSERAHYDNQLAAAVRGR